MRWLALALASLLTTPAAFGQDWAEIGALFAARCTICHSGDTAPMGLQLDSYENALAGGWMGPVLVSGDSAASRLIARLRGDVTPRMPLNGPPFLEDAEIARVEAWIDAGMPQGDPTAPQAERQRPEPGAPVTFADVEPIFLQRCAKCHSDNSIMGAPPEALRLASYADILRGGERLMLLPGNPEMSEIWRRVFGHGRPRMPFDGPPWLDDADIQLIYDWIAQGAPDADGTPAPIPAGRTLRLRGRLTAPNAIDGAVFIRDGGTRLDDVPAIGGAAEMRGVVLPDGQVRATRLRDR